ncbi:hypothetical protein [Ancylobacter defluvii]|uniref:Uncharacterized protein n=1 Tax=Ancylobacter defluvii TaxID=1282440 RepID=A0A9W6K1K8_9HYPH|nr:hypothetical protein [Ancylobacter defluvii]MBS7586729.1 hypothetical protein [Ancylobacter defluvii]GLK86030.1 hypothetical protein GCM10017653_41000 [Ancylobacter defluvii]
MSNTKQTPRSEPVDATMSDGWILHDGSGCPVDADAFVVVRFRSGREDLGLARARSWADHEQDRWVEDESDTVIVAYRIVRPEGR